MCRAEVAAGGAPRRLVFFIAVFPDQVSLTLPSLMAAIAVDPRETVGAIVRESSESHMRIEIAGRDLPGARDVAAAAAVLRTVGSWDESPVIHVHVNETSFAIEPRFTEAGWTAIEVASDAV